MTPFKASGGVVDRIAGLPLPQEITLYAILLSKKPNLDGTGFTPSDVVSDRAVRVNFEFDRDNLVNKNALEFHLVEGEWDHLYIQFHDQAGEPFAKGMVIARGSLEQWVRAVPDTVTVYPRRRM